MKKLLSLVLAFAMLLSVCVLAHGEEAAQKYDLKGMTVKVRNWDTPNPYAAETDQVDKDKCPDYVHMLVSIPPKISVSSFMGYLKGKSSVMLYEQFGEMKYR